MLRLLEVVPSTESWSELLAWVNASLPPLAPNGRKVNAMHRVEECGHGVPYVLLLPTMLPVLHQPLMTNSVKVPAKADFEAVANLKLMQAALRRNGIAQPEVLSKDMQKLIGGNFQANLQLLQWFRGLAVALDQCSIVGGEGRIVLEPASADDSLSVIEAPPLAVQRAEAPQRGPSKDAPVSDADTSDSEARRRRETRELTENGVAAAAAAVAVLRESQSLPRERSGETPASRLRSRQPPSLTTSVLMRELSGGRVSSRGQSRREPFTPCTAQLPSPLPRDASGQPANGSSPPSPMPQSSVQGLGLRTAPARGPGVVLKYPPAHLAAAAASARLLPANTADGASSAPSRAAAAGVSARRPPNVATRRHTAARPAAPLPQTEVPAARPHAGVAASRGAVSARPTVAAPAEAESGQDAELCHRKLRAIESLVMRLEARKAQQRQRSGDWEPKDAEMLAFAASIRQVLHGAVR